MTDKHNIDNIIINDAHENNLRHISLEVPKGELVVFCGVSGSGKSSLAFDTIANESNRQWQENYPLFLRNKMPHYDRAKVESIENLTPAVVVDQHSIGVSSRSTVGTALDAAPLVRLLFSRCGEPSAGGSMAYSANHPMGMCPRCTGLGTDLVLKEDLLFDTTKTLRDGAIRFSQFSNGWQTYLYQANPKINADKKLSDYTADEWDYLKYGERETDGSVSKKQIKVEIRSNNTGRIDKVDYEGVIPRFERLYLKRDITKLKKNLQDEILSFVEKGGCPACGGTGRITYDMAFAEPVVIVCEDCGGHRYSRQALSYTYKDKNIDEVMSLTVDEALEFFDTPKIRKPLKALQDVGIGYITLGQSTATLSGGEIQRIKLASELHKKGVVYILDEPSTGLHSKDAEKLLALFRKLVADGNTVIIIEHRLELIAQADYIIEMGQGGGTSGGEVVFQGTPQEIVHCERSKTGQYLKNEL